MRTALAAASMAALSLISPARAAFADSVVKQTVETTQDGAKTASTHLWSIDDGKFTLTVTSQRGETRYVFNGQTFYVCGKLDHTQVEALTKTGVQAKALQSFKTGACQAVPSNFLVRFFLSPMASVESVDATDGLKLTLGLQNYKLEPSQKSETVLGKSCQKVERSYTLTKTDGAAKAAKPASAAVHESFCQMPPLSWRSKLWMETAKAVMRQPRGSDLLKQLKQDMAHLPGFILRGEGRQESVDRSGKKHVQAFKLETTSVQTQELSARAFRLPEGYSVFSPESLELASAKGPEAAPGKPAVKGEASLVDMVSSVFFCAIASKFVCWGGD